MKVEHINWELAKTLWKYPKHRLGHEDDCDSDDMYHSSDISYGPYVECRHCRKSTFLTDYVGDWTQTIALRDKVANRLNAEWLYCAKRWVLRRYENQFPVSYPYENEQVSICMAALNALSEEEYELDD